LLLLSFVHRLAAFFSSVPDLPCVNVCEHITNADFSTTSCTDHAHCQYGDSPIAHNCGGIACRRRARAHPPAGTAHLLPPNAVGVPQLTLRQCRRRSIGWRKLLRCQRAWRHVLRLRLRGRLSSQSRTRGVGQRRRRPTIEHVGCAACGSSSAGGGGAIRGAADGGSRCAASAPSDSRCGCDCGSACGCRRTTSHGASGSSASGPANGDDGCAACSISLARG